MPRTSRRQPIRPGPANDNQIRLGPDERKYVFAVAMKYVKDEDAASDVTQEAMLLAHRHRHTFRGDSRFSTWLYRVAATTALMHLRKQRRRSREVLVPQRVSDDDGPALWEHRDLSAGPDREVAAAEAVALVRQHVDGLGEKYRDIFWMRFFEGYTEAEIASKLDLALTTVKTRAFRARVSVRDHLIEHLAEIQSGRGKGTSQLPV